MVSSVGNIGNAVKNQSVKSAAQDLSGTFGEMFDEVNDAMLNADKKMADLAIGKNKDIHGTMIAMEKADVSQRLLMAVRSKVVAAYEEIMRMPI